MRSSQAVVSRRANVQQHYHRIKTSSKFPGNTGNRFLNCFNDLVAVEKQRKIWCDESFFNENFWPNLCLVCVSA